MPELQDFVFITDNAYTKEEILAMERSILVTLQFNVTVPSSYRFLQRFCKIIKAQDKLFHLAQYIVELTLIEQRMLVFKPSQIAASALWLALKILYHESGRWSTELVHHSSYNEHHLRPCVKDMCILFTGIERCSLQMVRKKFALARYNKVALIRITPFWEPEISLTWLKDILKAQVLPWNVNVPYNPTLYKLQRIHAIYCQQIHSHWPEKRSKFWWTHLE